MRAAFSPPRPGNGVSPRIAVALPAASTFLVLAVAILAAPAAATIYTYENSTSGTLSNAATPCSNPLVRTFTVSESFTVSGIAIGVNLSHNNRGDIRATLVAPDNSSLQFVSESGDTDNNYDILVSTNSEGGLDDNSDDVVAEPYFNRLVSVGALSFYTGDSAGTWTLRLCDTAAATNGTFNRARLVLRDAASTVGQVCTSKSSYNWGANGDNVAFPGGGITVDGVTMTLASIQDPTGDASGYDVFANSLRTQTDTLGNDAGIFFMGMDLESGELESAMIRTNWAFSVAVRDLRWTILDVDRVLPRTTRKTTFASVPPMPTV